MTKPSGLDVHVCVELTQRLVKVVHLGQNAHRGDEDEDVSAWVGELVASGKSELDGDTDALDGHDGNGSDGAADGEVHERVLASVARRDAVDHDNGEDGHEDAVEEEARLDGVVEDLVNRLHFLVWRSVQHNDDRAEETHGAAQLSERA